MPSIFCLPETSSKILNWFAKNAEKRKKIACIRKEGPKKELTDCRQQIDDFDHQEVLNSFRSERKRRKLELLARDFSSKITTSSEDEYWQKNGGYGGIITWINSVLKNSEYQRIYDSISNSSDLDDADKLKFSEWFYAIGGEQTVDSAIDLSHPFHQFIFEFSHLFQYTDSLFSSKKKSDDEFKTRARAFIEISDFLAKILPDIFNPLIMNHPKMAYLPKFDLDHATLLFGESLKYNAITDIIEGNDSYRGEIKDLESYFDSIDIEQTDLPEIIKEIKSKDLYKSLELFLSEVDSESEKKQYFDFWKSSISSEIRNAIESQGSVFRIQPEQFDTQEQDVANYIAQRKERIRKMETILSQIKYEDISREIF